MSLFSPTSNNIPSGDYLYMKNRNVTISQGARIVQPLEELVDELLPGVPGYQFVNALKENSEFRLVSISPESLNKDSAVLSAFHGLNALSTAADIHDALERSWDESPDLTLRIIWNMRSIHEGQGNKIGFYRAFGWLYKHYPRTAIKNLKFLIEESCPRTIIHNLKIEPKDDHFPSPNGAESILDERQSEEIETKLPHGCYKDLLNILVLALREELTDPKLKEYRSLNVPPQQPTKRLRSEFESMKKVKAMQNERFGQDRAIEIRKAKSYEKDANRALNARKQRQSKYKEDFNVLKHKLEGDNQFLALYATVAHIFADHLAKDIRTLKTIESASSEEAFMLKFQLSNSSKWAPTLECFHDRATNIATAVALILYSRGLMPEISVGSASNLSQESTHIIRSYYRRWFISPLRSFTDVTEIKMSDGRWSDIDYDHVSSKCLLANRSNFWTQDRDRLKNHFAAHSKINRTTLKPHELLAAALKLDFETRTQIEELPPPRYEPITPPFYYFETPLGQFKCNTLEDARRLTNELGASIDFAKRKIQLNPNITARLAIMLAQASASSVPISTPSTPAAPSAPSAPSAPLAPLATSVSSAPPATVSNATKIAIPATSIAARSGQRCTVIHDKDGRKFVMIGRIKIEVKPPPPAHQVLAEEVNERSSRTWSAHKRELLPASIDTEAKREGLLDRHSTMKNLIESQWDAIVENLGGPGTLQGTLAIVDFNHSMGFPLSSDWYHSRPKKRNPITPLLPAMALGTLLSRLSKLPFKDIVLVSQEEPQLLELPNHGLFEASKYVSGIGLKSESSLESVFLKLLLPTAINRKTKPDDMVKRYFVFSDLEFESLAAEETHARIGRAFRRAGYKAPEIVYWNLQRDRPMPAHEDTSGCGMVTGFSSNPLRLFTNDRPPTRDEPHEVMKMALEKSCYDMLEVFDPPTKKTDQTGPSGGTRGGRGGRGLRGRGRSGGSGLVGSERGGRGGSRRGFARG